MADTPENGAAAPQEPQQVQLQILAQFIRDMSFENIVVQKGVQGEVQPEMQVAVAVDARKRTTPNQYEVTLKCKVESKNRSDSATLFLLELDYGAVFQIEGVPEDQLHPFLLIECPRQIFPFVRRIVSDVTRDGNFPPVNLQNIDFVALYRQELAKRAESQPRADA
ncbi:MAG: protein-export chaperone SecB [Vannielia sp.]|uniref:protein-export chaperone SecB n=1 Tax=Rhodobacterales TaxID=204455 RepID=UPI002094E534|nr:protein-export chaperone SecB [Oceanicola sp. 502str15]MCO6384183.1 protein-export chaperone SecB [Oceanicola sp. 502str15]